MGLLWLWLPVAALALALALLLAAWLGLRRRSRQLAAGSELSSSLAGRETVGFFHPYAHAGGGGERVLWCAVHAVQQRHPGLHCVIYTGDVTVPKAKFLELAQDRFGVHLEPETVHFAFLKGRGWVDAATWRRFTLLGQSLGSILLGWEALCAFRPDIFIDSMGYAFTLPLFALVGGCRVGCYVHYPTISTDMLARVQTRDISVCNDATIARSRLLSTAKLLYYIAFAKMYGFVGRFAEVVMVNSSWTRNHINSLWKVPHRTHVVFPPCDTTTLASLPLQRGQWGGDGLFILSLAQFRPEKNHALQLRALARFFQIAPHHRMCGPDRVRLILAGGCRDDADRERVGLLRSLCVDLGLRERPECDAGQPPQDQVDWDVAFRTNVTVSEMQGLLGEATVGLHTMREEHFGINVVEFMAAGAVPLAHDSGGPAMDIVTPLVGQRTGFLARDEASYAGALQEIFGLNTEERGRIAQAAREAVRRFAQEDFEVAVADLMIAPLRRGCA